MGWFERQVRGRTPVEVEREHARYLRASGLIPSLDQLAGPYGCRRFTVRFEVRGGKVRLGGIEGVPLAWGGGPPPVDHAGQATEKVLTSLQRLHANMSLGPSWSRGVVAYVRDARGITQITPAFDEDSDAIDPVDLPVPGPPGHPLEDPDTLELLAMKQRDLQRIHAATRTRSADWDWWEIDDNDQLVLHYSDGRVDPSFRCVVLATHETRHSRFSWVSERPVGAAAVFRAAPFASTFDASVELGLLACAVVGADWLFVQSYDEHDSQLLVAAFR